MDKKFIYIAAAFLVICGLGLNLLFYDDEAIYIHFFEFFEKGLYPDYQTQPVAGTIYYAILWIISGTFNFLTGWQFPLRLFPILFGLLTLYLTFIFAKKIYGRRTALISSAIMASSFYFIFASVRMDLDGNFLTLLLTAAFYFYYRARFEAGRKELILSGICLGLAILTKYSSIFVFIPILALELVLRRKKDFKYFFILLTVSGLISVLFPLVTYLLSRPEIFELTIQWGGRSISMMPADIIGWAKVLFTHLYRILQYGTPILIFLPLVALLTGVRKRQELILPFWLISCFFVILILMPYGDIARYQMFLIPPMAILSGVVIDKIISNFNRRVWFLLLVLTSILLMIVIGLNLFSFTNQPFSFYFFKPDLLALNPPVWYTGTSGPAFTVSLYSLFFVLSFGGLSFLGLILTKNEIRKKLFLCALLAIGFAFNIFLLEEYFFYGLSPNYNQTIEEMVDFYQSNELSSPVFSIDEDIPYYLGLGMHDYYDLEAGEKRKNLSKGGTVLYLNLDPTKGSYIWQDIEANCQLIKTFYSKGFEAGFVFTCPKS